MMISIYIEGKEYKVKKSKNILEVCLSLGFDVPYFCWHPALGSVGSCRQCAVKEYSNNDKCVKKNNGRLVMSCMTPVTSGSSIYIFDEDVKQFRKEILELLMINHPHDCPVCEEGGNCHLQDMTVMTGQVHRRYRFEKRTHYNQYLGSFINHEMNRCITCYRCVRYYNDYAGGKDLGVFGVHDNIYFGRVENGILQSEFSGNLIEICPTGVFTDKTQSDSYVRKWDLLFSPSICHQCSIGCNVILGERYGKLCRVENRYNGDVNGYFLCDLGRFNHDYINSKNRLKRPIQKKDNIWVSLSAKQAIKNVTTELKKFTKEEVIGIGSQRASIESNFALRKLVGSKNFCTGIGKDEQDRLLLIFKILCSGKIHIPSLREIEKYDAILILGEDVTQTGARLALSLRQAVKGKSREMAFDYGIFDWQQLAVKNIGQDSKYPLFITSIDQTKLDDIATLVYYDSLKNQARFGFAISNSLSSKVFLKESFDFKLKNKLDIIVQALKRSCKPLIVSGSNAGSKELISAAFSIANALKACGKDVGITFVVPSVNSIGLMMMGGKNLDEMCENVFRKKSVFFNLIVLENDLYKNINKLIVSRILKKINCLILLDNQYNALQKHANLVFPLTNFVESDGTVVNFEGRAQRFFRLYNPSYYDKETEIFEGWRWLYLMHFDYINCSYKKENLNFDYVFNAVIDEFPQFSKIKKAFPNSSFRVCGQKIASAPHRYSGRTSMYSNIDVHEPNIFRSYETMFSFSMEGNYSVKPKHKQVPFVWAPGWNSPQAWNKFQDEVGGHLYYGDPGKLLFNNFKESVEKNLCQIDNLEKHINYIINTEKVHFVKKWIILPYWNLFGSNETALFSSFFQNHIPKSYVIVNVLDAKNLNLQSGMYLKFECIDRVLCFPIKISKNITMGHIGLLMGTPETPIFLSGTYVKNLQGIIRD